jgi:hypothetical protein
MSGLSTWQQADVTKLPVRVQVIDLADDNHSIALDPRMSVEERPV